MADGLKSSTHFRESRFLRYHLDQKIKNLGLSPIYNLKIKYKLLIGFLLVIAFGLVTALAIGPEILYKNMEKGINERIDDLLNVTTNHIKDTQREVLLYANLVSSRDDVINYMDWGVKMDPSTRTLQLSKILSRQIEWTNGETPQAMEIIASPSSLGSSKTIKAAAAAAGFQYLDKKTVRYYQEFLSIQSTIAQRRVARNAEIEDNNGLLAIVATSPINSPRELLRPWSFSGILVITYPLDNNFISNLQQRIDDEIHLTLYKANKEGTSAISVATTITDENGEPLTGKKLENPAITRIMKASESENRHIADTTIDGKPFWLSYAPLLGKNGLAGFLEIAIPSETLLKETARTKHQIYIYTILSSLLALVIMIWILSSISIPLNQLIIGTEMIAKGDFKQRIKIFAKDELGLLAEKFNWMTENIQKQQKELIKKRQIEQELKVAHNIQAHLLPQQAPKLAGVDIASFALPAKEVGGDLFDFLYNPDDPDKLGIVIADVSGKSVPAALYMTMTKVLIQTLAEKNTSPENVLTDINRLMIKNMDSKSFITLFYALVDLKNMCITYANAGHNLPIIFSAKNGNNCFVEDPDIETSALCIDKDFIFKGSNIKIDKGDTLVFYTDGVTEAFNKLDEQYGEGRLINIVKNNLHLPAADIISAVTKSLMEFMDNELQTDDITIVIVKL